MFGRTPRDAGKDTGPAGVPDGDLVDTQGNDHRRRRRIWRRVGATLLSGVLAAGIALGLLLAATPSVGDLPARAQRWRAAHGVRQVQDALPARVAAAVLAVEDHRFHHHLGLDLLAVRRIGVGLVTGTDQGGSTIEVQLAKLLYTGGRRNLTAQVEQAGLAIKMDLSYPKSRILLTYLNSEYFGHGYYGITAAAYGYFGRAPRDLDWAQAATLAGLLQAPTDDDPLAHPGRALQRRDHVLSRLHAVGAITAAEAARYAGSGLELRSSVPPPNPVP